MSLIAVRLPKRQSCSLIKETLEAATRFKKDLFMINSYLCYITNEGERPGRKNTLERVTRKLELKLAAGTSRRNRKSKGAKGHGYEDR